MRVTQIQEKCIKLSRSAFEGMVLGKRFVDDVQHQGTLTSDSQQGFCPNTAWGVAGGGGVGGGGGGGHLQLTLPYLFFIQNEKSLV